MMYLRLYGVLCVSCFFCFMIFFVFFFYFYYFYFLFVVIVFVCMYVVVFFGYSFCVLFGGLFRRYSGDAPLASHCNPVSGCQLSGIFSATARD